MTINYAASVALEAIFGQFFEIALRDCSPVTFYMPLLKFPEGFTLI